MKDLDFDELDRAVNSLMTNVPDFETSKPDVAEKTLDITSTLGDDVTPSFTTLNAATAKATGSVTPMPSPQTAPAAASASVPAAVSSSPLASRRGGRFMDVVHPSSDMKKPTIPARPKVSRQGATIAPSIAANFHRPSAVSTPAPEKRPSTVVDVEPSTAAPQPAVPAHEPTMPASDWPDPLEMADFKDTPAPVESPSVAQAPTPKEKVDEPKETPHVEALLEAGEEGESSPLTSPFLSGTKVDKRPLGGSSADLTEEPDRPPAFGAMPGDTMTVNDPDSQLPSTPPKNVEPELPEELKGDLMAIEADTTTHGAATAEPKPAVESSPWTEEKEESSAPTVLHVATPASSSAVSPVAPHEDEKLLTAGPTSIPQQYREEPNTGDKDNGAIYDTDSYHQPLAHPVKKKSGWLWVLWIVVILIVGAGGGAALYFFGIV